MLINGLQKLTLLDYPGRTACTVFTGGCNFRCPFCHNPSLVLEPEKQPAISPEELAAFLEKRRRVLDGVCISGGEPTIHDDLPELAEKIKKLGYSVKLDTNGSRPAMLRELLENGLIDYAAMDIKSSPSGYAGAAGLPEIDLAPIEESAALLMEGRIPYEFRITAVKGIHEPADFAEIGAWLKKADKIYIQSFKDSGALLGARGRAPEMSAFSGPELERLLGELRRHAGSAELRGAD